MVATSASMDLLQNLHALFLEHVFLQQFFLRVLAHKLPLDQHIMLSTPHEMFHLSLIMGNLCRGEIPNEWLSLVGAGGWNCSDQLVCRWLFSYRLLFFLDGWLDKVLNENSVGISARADPSFDSLSAASLSARTM
jgi:hypothetical protein